MNSVGLITLMLALSSSPPPTDPIFKQTIVICKEIKYVYQIDKYPYVGINLGGSKNYLTNETDYGIMMSKLEKDCKQ